jgi:hypothetical protein
MGRPEDALDYPKIPDDKFVIWSGNEHLWPDGRRETHYLSDKRDIMKGFPLFSPFPEAALTFDAREEALAVVEAGNAMRPHPYNVEITTVAELKRLRGYAPEPEEAAPEP